MYLFTPAWQNPDRGKALIAIKKETNQKRLIRAAREANSQWVRAAAVRKLADQNIIADIAKHDELLYIRVEAIICLSNISLAQELFTTVFNMLHEKDWFDDISVESAEEIAKKFPDMSIAKNFPDIVTKGKEGKRKYDEDIQRARNERNKLGACPWCGRTGGLSLSQHSNMTTLKCSICGRSELST